MRAVDVPEVSHLTIAVRVQEDFKAEVMDRRLSLVGVLEVRLRMIAQELGALIDTSLLCLHHSHSLQAFPSVTLPVAAFLDLAERTQPAYYSISSSPKVQYRHSPARASLSLLHSFFPLSLSLSLSLSFSPISFSLALTLSLALARSLSL
jgi:hypothetical protein